MNKGSYAAAELLFATLAKKQRRYRSASKRVYVVNPVPAESQSDKREREREILNSRESLEIGALDGDIRFASGIQFGLIKM